MSARACTRCCTPLRPRAVVSWRNGRQHIRHVPVRTCPTCGQHVNRN